MRMLSSLVWVSLALVIFIGSSERARAEKPRPVTIFAASSLKEVVASLAEAFAKAADGAPVESQLLGSQQLAIQLQQGAQADVFLSAHPRQMEDLVRAGRVRAEDVRPFAANRLIVLAADAGPVQTFADLARPGLRLVLAAPEVPAGRYARECLAKAAAIAGLPSDFADRVLANVVSYEPNVRAAASKVVLGEADATIVYETDAAAFRRERVRTAAIPAGAQVVAVYDAAALADAPNRAGAEAWMRFLVSEQGRGILAAHGFEPPPPGA